MSRKTAVRSAALPLVALLLAGPARSSSERDVLAHLARKFAADVRVLASDRMEGRGLGTEGIRRAAGWIEDRLSRLGLRPAFAGGYRQRFPIKTGVSLREGNRLTGVEAGDWTPLAFSSPGEFSGEIAFVGYGIEAPSIGYQELSGVDLKGKVALVLRYEPQERDDGSPFDGRRPSRWSALRYKVLQARERGAVAVVFTSGPLQKDERDRLPPLRNDGPQSPAGIPVLQVKTGVAERWLAGTEIDLSEFQKAVDRDLKPRSREATGKRVGGAVRVEPAFAQAENVAAILPGRGELTDQVVVIGAHYDHLGSGGEGSMKPNVKAIHNGADDNASGTVGVLLAAERLKTLLAAAPSHRTILFALFAGEEVGLAGSAHFVAHPPMPLSKVVSMINLDMVGRLRDDKLVAFGTQSAAEWDELIRRASAPLRLDVTSRGDGYGPSDQTSFYAAHIPVLHFFTGPHPEYHSPDDDAASVNAEGGARVAEFTARVAADVARGAITPVYSRAAAAPAMTGDSRGYGAYLGTVPDFASTTEGGGVLLSDVRPMSPADRAGLQRKDRIVRIASTRIDNLYDMTFALQEHRPGDTVEIEIVRGKTPLVVKATLGDRRSAAEAPSPRTGPASARPAAPGPAPAPAPATQAQPRDPHAAPPAAAPRATETPGFYEGRPGKDFVVRAGKPFARAIAAERHLADIRQLTFGGENAEAYFSPDGRRLVFQATVSPAQCDQQFVLDLETGETRRVSDGKGRTTCGYFDWPETDRILYSSTASESADCPAPPDRSRGYVWAVHKSFEVYEVPPAGGAPKRLTENRAYDAEATWCHRGGRLVFTSDRDGDLDLYEMDESGGVRRLTREPGYDGGAVYSPDCSEIAWRAGRPKGADLEEYRSLLAQGLVRPGALEILVMASDGSEARSVTSNGAANFAPTFHPDGNRILYSSNVGASAREFDLWLVDKRDGKSERITSAPGFDGFPEFSPDGRYLVWASNRANPEGRETNLFIARWVE
ncbi:MAG: M28 family peptidase [Thermoanaerobaculia bacterium]